MRIYELAIEVGMSESTLLRNFARSKKNLAKKGIYIDKNGRGRTADYSVRRVELLASPEEISRQYMEEQRLMAAKKE